jgi:hypothetical protein
MTSGVPGAGHPRMSERACRGPLSGHASDLVDGAPTAFLYDRNRVTAVLEG